MNIDGEDKAGVTIGPAVFALNRAGADDDHVAADCGGGLDVHRGRACQTKRPVTASKQSNAQSRSLCNPWPMITYRPSEVIAGVLKNGLSGSLPTSHLPDRFARVGVEASQQPRKASQVAFAACSKTRLPTMRGEDKNSVPSGAKVHSVARFRARTPP